MPSMLSRNLTLAALAVLGSTVASITPASAHYTTTRCDRDGDECYVVRCDDDGDDCRRISSYSPYNYYRRAYRPGYLNGFGYWNGLSLYYQSGGRDRYDDYYYRQHERDEDDEDDEW